MATAYINQHLTDYASLKIRVLSGASSTAVQKFDALNAHLPRPFIETGHLVIVPSNTTKESTADEAWLMKRAEEISRALDRDPKAGKLVGSVSRAFIGGEIGGTLGPAMCRLFWGIATRGAEGLSCAIIGGDAGGSTVGYFFGGYGASWGEMLYADDDLWI